MPVNEGFEIAKLSCEEKGGFFCGLDTKSNRICSFVKTCDLRYRENPMINASSHILQQKSVCRWGMAVWNDIEVVE